MDLAMFIDYVSVINNVSLKYIYIYIYIINNVCVLTENEDI